MGSHKCRLRVQGRWRGEGHRAWGLSPASPAAEQSSMFVGMGWPDGDAIFLLLEHVCILILKSAYVEFKLCQRMLELCTASELRVDGAESDTSHKFLLFSGCAPAPACLAFCCAPLPASDWLLIRLRLRLLVLLPALTI